MEGISPFFVLEAENKIDAELFDEAILLCKNGLSEFPDYYSGWIVLIKALIKNQQFDEAKEKIEFAINKFPNIETFQNLLNDLEDKIQLSETNSIETDSAYQNEEIGENKSDDFLVYNEKENVDIISDQQEESIEIIRDRNWEEGTSETNIQNRENEYINLESQKEIENINLAKGFLKHFFEPDSINFEDNGELSRELYDLIPSIPDESLLERRSFRELNIIDLSSGINLAKDSDSKKQLKDEIVVENLPEHIEDEFTRIAKKLENAKIPQIIDKEEETTKTENYKSKEKPKTIVSETMANIYEQQGAYEEAEKAYKELLENNPQRKQYFLDKLQKLYKKMS